jgi:hypothetical protein
MGDVALAMKPLLTGQSSEADRQMARHLFARMGVAEPASCIELRDQLIRTTEALGALPGGVGGKALSMIYDENIKLLGE